MKMTPLEQARALDSRVRKLRKRENTTRAQIAVLLRSMKQKRSFAWLGKASIAQYARDALDYSGSLTRDLIALVDRLDHLPAMRRAFMTGELDWTKARTASSVATPENETEWLDRAKRWTNRQLELEAAEARGEEPRTRFAFDWTPDERATIEDAMHAVRKDTGRALTDAEALVLVARRAISENGGAGGPRHRVVIHRCGECERSVRQTNDGELEVKPEKVEAILCDAEVLDVREGPAKVKRTMPKKIADYIDARDKGRCRVPGCNNRIEQDRHHEGGWREVGHDPDRCLLLCEDHHIARHMDELTIEGTAPDFVFMLADGTVIADRDGASREAPIASAPTSASREASRGEIDDIVIAALTSLGMKPREARRAVRRARERLARPPTEVNELLAAALRWARSA